MKIFLCTAADTNYFNNPMFKDCLKSYSENTTKVEKRVFLVDYDDSDVFTYEIDKTFIDWKDIKSKNTNKCIQHGEFVNFFEECSEEDIIVFTDGDIVLQREFSDEEIELIKNIPERTFLANFNFKLDSSLEDIMSVADERTLLNFLKTNYDIERNDLKNYKEMNTGVLIGRKKDFHELSELYGETFNQISRIINGIHCQQYLINVIINKYFNYIPLDYSFHSHAHHSIRNSDESYTYDEKVQSGVPSKLVFKDGKYEYKDQIILFAHKLHQYRY